MNFQRAPIAIVSDANNGTLPTAVEAAGAVEGSRQVL